MEETLGKKMKIRYFDDMKELCFGTLTKEEKEIEETFKKKKMKIRYFDEMKKLYGETLTDDEIRKKIDRETSMEPQSDTLYPVMVMRHKLGDTPLYDEIREGMWFVSHIHELDDDEEIQLIIESITPNVIVPLYLTRDRIEELLGKTITDKEFGEYLDKWNETTLKDGMIDEMRWFVKDLLEGKYDEE